MPAPIPSNVRNAQGIDENVSAAVLVASNGERLGDPVSRTVTIAATAATTPELSVSEIVDVRDIILDRLVMPAAWDAASITFSTSEDGVALQSLHDGGTEVSLPVAPDRSVVLPRDLFRTVRYIRLRSGTPATPVAQLAARAITLVGMAR